MRVIGIDPGSRLTGWGVIDRTGNRLQGIAAGVIQANAQAPLHERLCAIYTSLKEVMVTYEPQVMAIEDLFFAAKYVQAALTLGHARGVILLAAAEKGLPIHSYAPAVVKRAIAGSGRAEKHQVARMVEGLLGWQKMMQPDTTDALAIALTHLSTHVARAVATSATPLQTTATQNRREPVQRRSSLPRFRSR
jgi:crossover junction endodeoxyribonuclease RuvC